VHRTAHLPPARPCLHRAPLIYKRPPAALLFHLFPPRPDLTTSISLHSPSTVSKLPCAAVFRAKRCSTSPTTRPRAPTDSFCLAHLAVVAAHSTTRVSLSRPTIVRFPRIHGHCRLLETVTIFTVFPPTHTQTQCLSISTGTTPSASPVTSRQPGPPTAQSLAASQTTRRHHQHPALAPAHRL
jgi:hypothetical protein